MSRKCRLRSYKSIGDDGKWAADRIAQLEKQRDELLAALENLYSEFERTREWGCIPMALVRARAAVVAIKAVLG